MKIAIITPSRLARSRTTGQLFLEGVLQNLAAQSVRSQHLVQVFVGLDPGVPVPQLDTPLDVTFSWGALARQSVAANAALAAARAAAPDAIAFFEDDDLWEIEKLDLQLARLGEFDFVSCNQFSVTESGKVVGVFDFPTPSGWLMPSEVWQRVGDFSADQACHLDTEWLGRANALGLKRVHLVNRDAHSETLQKVARFSAIEHVGERPLVTRLYNDEGMMARVRSGALAQLSADEYAEFMLKFGEEPF